MVNSTLFIPAMFLGDGQKLRGKSFFQLQTCKAKGDIEWRRYGWLETCHLVWARLYLAASLDSRQGQECDHGRHHPVTRCVKPSRNGVSANAKLIKREGQTWKSVSPGPRTVKCHSNKFSSRGAACSVLLMTHPNFSRRVREISSYWISYTITCTKTALAGAEYKIWPIFGSGGD